jgi:Ca-activated chloride channel family protein
MKQKAGLAVLAMVFMVLWCVQVFAAAEKESLSPYFLVQGAGDTEAFPLLSTSADVHIAGMTAQTELKQVYKNDGKKTIEAVYIFPLGTKAAVNAMRMQIGTRVIEADIHKNEEARQIYENAKNHGQTASLLEQKRPNVFQMNVANIMPGDKVEVTVYYSEALVPEDGEYGFVFPTVVGPRFTGESSPEDLKDKDNWTVNPYQHEGKSAPYTFEMAVEIKSGIPVAKAWSTSHKVITDFTDASNVKVTLSPKEENGGNRDFILKYTLRGNKINTGVLLYPGQDENFFLTMIEPPAEVVSSMIPPREYLFIMDVSGSMYGFPLETSKKVIKAILSNLRGQDYFNIMFFSGGSNTLFEKPMPATQHNRDLAVEMITKQQGSGGTEILDAMTKASGLPKKEGMSRIIVTMTDGYVSVEKGVFDLMEKKMGSANFFSFGIGSSVNRYLIEGMARMGKGEPFVVTGQDEAQAAADKFIKYIKSPVLTDIKVKFDGFDAYDVEPVSVPDLFAQRPLVISGKYKHASGRIVVTGKTANGNFEKVIEIGSIGQDAKNEAVKYLWARERVAKLDDYSQVGSDVKEEVTQLGLKYHLMTAYTSFVAVDKVVRETGEVVTVKQPLPLPEGVSDYAVGDKEESEQSYNAAPYGGATRSMAAPAPAAMAEDAEEEKSIDMPAGYALKAKAAKKPDYSNAKDKTTSLVLSGGSVPAGYTLDEAENEVLGKISNELSAYFSSNGLTGLEVQLKVENGAVKDVLVKSFKGKGFDLESLKKLFVKVGFGSESGEIVLQLELI